MASGINPNERRTAPRVAERIRFALLQDGNTLEAETRNLSTSGAYCTTSRFIAPMTKLQVQFDLPGGARKSTIRCTGVVVRAEPVIAAPDRGEFHIAIFFSDLSERDREAIAQFVRARLASATPTR